MNKRYELQNINNLKSKKYSSKGITLVSLVIIIIIMLILLSVSVLFISNNGIFQKASNTSSQTTYSSEYQILLEELSGDDAFETLTHSKEVDTLAVAKNLNKRCNIKETESAKWYWDEDSLSFISPNNNKFPYGIVTNTEDGIVPNTEVGNYVDYTYDIADNYVIDSSAKYIKNGVNFAQTTDMKWRILYTTNSSIALISNKRTTDKLTFTKDGTGNNYNNGVNIINDICRYHYSNLDYTQGITVRNINFEDIKKIVTNADDMNSFSYTLPEGKTSIRVPSSFLLESGCMNNGVATGTKGQSDEFDSLYSGNNLTNITGPITINYCPSGNAFGLFVMNFENDIIKDTLELEQSDYFLSTRSVSQSNNTNVIEFGLMFVIEDSIYPGQGYNTFNWGYSDDSAYLRPIVILDLDSYSFGNESGTIDNPISITKKY